ncbi:MAG TPA: hypothetical protein IGS52_23325 [Oscillatoriaceae cyanobacterium M33_DOE_052]|uniref:Uncharacterized protein n=1 Tax=Planktothricoides sp. SpSt-374 TaxID=2282167 RepID=A0A7C3ZZ86_9CYAN|nr:hypothetical protein [Oscillatoriaceae cyanobacterium M33_DOE_052]
MPKYTLDEVIDIIKTLSVEEKASLQEKLPELLGAAAAGGNQAWAQQSQSFGNLTMGDGGAFNVSQVAAQGNVDLDQSTTKVTGASGNVDEILQGLNGLKQEIVNSGLNKLEQKTAEAGIEVLAEEVKKLKPDKDLIDQTLAALEKGLRGAEKLIEPTMRISALVAKLWLI